MILEYLAQHIESLIFSSQNPISFKDIHSCLENTFETEFKKPEVEEAIDSLKERYSSDSFAFDIVEIGGGFQFLSKGIYHKTVGTHLRQTTKKRLSKAALESLAIIAYKQPVSKTELEKIRGVNCDYSVQKLLEKELVIISGRSEGPGRPLLYSTSPKFMDYFGISSLDELPKPKDFGTDENTVGEAAPIEEEVSTGIQSQSANIPEAQGIIDEIVDISAALLIAIDGEPEMVVEESTEVIEASHPIEATEEIKSEEE